MHDREEPEEVERDTALARELRHTLRQPVSLPEGLEDRIVHAVLVSTPARAESAAALKKTAARRDWRRSVAAVLLFGVLTGIGSGYLLGRRGREQQTQRAQTQFALAMRITDSTLRGVRQQVRQQLGQATTVVTEAAR